MKRGPAPCSNRRTSSVETVAAKWGDEAPAFLRALAAACDETSQNDVAKKLDFSAGVISAVLNRTYPSDLNPLRRAFAGAFEASVVDCPVLGELAEQRCQAFQRRPFSAANPQAARLWKACRSGCPYSRHSGGET